MKQLLPLYNPRTAPFMGETTAMSAMALGDGHWASAINVNSDGDVMRVRYGARAIQATSPLTGGAFVGAWSGGMNGEAVVLSAWALNSLTYIYKLNLDTGVWTEITEHNGKYGRSRMSGYTPVSYAVVRDKTTISGEAMEYVVIQNGVDYPRVWSGTQMSVHKPITVPSRKIARTVFRPATVLNKPYEGVRVNSSANFAWSQPNAKDGTAKLTYTGSATTGNYAYLIPDTRYTYGNTGKHMLLGIVTSDWESFLQDIKIVGWYSDADPFASATKATITVYDSATDPLPLIIPLNDDGSAYVCAFDVEARLADVTSVHLNWPPLWLRGLIFYFQPADPSSIGSGGSVEITLMAQGGTVQGATQFAMSYLNSGSRAESPSVVAPNVTLTSIRTTIPASSGGSYKTEKLPIREDLYYNCLLNCSIPTMADINAGADTTVAYKLRPGAADFYESKAYAHATWSGYSWTPATTPGRQAEYANDDEDGLPLIAPDGYHLPVPIANVITASGERLVCGQVRDSITDTLTHGEVWISEDGRPFRFRSVIRYLDQNVPDYSSPVRVSFGGEKVQAVKSLSGTLLGVDSINVFTDSSYYVLDGADSFQLSRPRRVANLGTPSGRSIAYHQNTMYWLDSERQIRRNSPEVSPVSRHRTDDQLINAASVTGACSAFFKDRYYLAFTPNGGSIRSRVMVYDERADKFTSHLYPFEIEQFVYADTRGTFTPNYKRMLLAFTPTGACYELESSSQTTDAGTAIPVTLKPREIHFDAWKTFTLGRVGIVCDDAAASTLTVARAFKPSGSASSAVSLDVTSGGVYRWDKDTYNNPAGGIGMACQITLSGNVVGGTTFYSIVTEVEESAEDADVE